MKKLVIVGCGRLAEIVADAVVKGLLPDYNLVGVYSRTASKAAHIVNKMQQHGKPCIACAKLEELLALKPDYLVESASPAAMRELALPALRNGTSVITLSIGALADETFYQEVTGNRQSKWYTGLYCIRSYRWIRCFKNCLSDGKYDGPLLQ